MDPNKEWIEESNSFWKDIIYRDGKIDEEQVLKELSDFYYVMKQVPRIYCHITGGKLSKVMYSAETIIAESNDYQQKCFEEYRKEWEEDSEG